MQHNASEAVKMGEALTPDKIMMFAKKSGTSLGACATVQSHQLEGEESLEGIKDVMTNELTIQMVRKVGSDVMRIKWIEDLRNHYI